MDLWHNCVKWWFLQAFFFLILIFWVIRGVKEQTWSKIRKLLCHTLYLWSHTSYDSYLWLISPQYLFIFSKFWFFKLGGVGGKREKNGPKLEKILSVTLHISGTIHTSWYSFMIHMCKRISPDVFFIFSKFCFSRLLGGKRAKNG